MNFLATFSAIVFKEALHLRRDPVTLVVTIAKGGTVIALPALHPGLPLPIWR